MRKSVKHVACSSFDLEDRGENEGERRCKLHFVMFQLVGSLVRVCRWFIGLFCPSLCTSLGSIRWLGGVCLRRRNHIHNYTA